MLTHLYLGVIFLAVLATFAYADIYIDCLKNSVGITWRISPEMVQYAPRLFLGSCMPSKLNVLPNGEAEAQFNYTFSECRFKRVVKGKHLLYRNKLTFKPHGKSKLAQYEYPVECVYKRSDRLVPVFLSPGSGVSEGRGGLVFHMALLNEQMTAIAKTNIIPLGSFMPIWAAVEQRFHQPLLLLMDECVAASSPELQPGSQVYPIVGNKGCLLEGMRGNSTFLPRYHSSAIILYLQSFKFPFGEEVYIHCNLAVWDPEIFDESKKACNYVKELEGWELLDDPTQSSLCRCCDSTCKSRRRRRVHWGSQGFSHKSVLGPLIIVDPSDSRAYNIPQSDSLRTAL